MFDHCTAGDFSESAISVAGHVHGVHSLCQFPVALYPGMDCRRSGAHVAIGPSPARREMERGKAKRHLIVRLSTRASATSTDCRSALRLAALPQAAYFWGAPLASIPSGGVISVPLASLPRRRWSAVGERMACYRTLPQSSSPRGVPLASDEDPGLSSGHGVRSLTSRSARWVGERLRTWRYNMLLTARRHSAQSMQLMSAKDA